MRTRKANERGEFRNEWLHARHALSFADYYDPEWMQFGRMRVLNHDVVQPGTGFMPHGHRDMEILTYVFRGVVEHTDSMGNKKHIHAGELQRMSAGTGVRHSEINPSETDELELLQIWFLPEREGLPPGYEQKSFPVEERMNKIVTLCAREREGQALQIFSPITVRGGVFNVPTESALSRLSENTWVQVVKGELTVSGQRFQSVMRQYSRRKILPALTFRPKALNS